MAKKLVHEQKRKQIIEKIDEEYFEETMLKFFLIAYAPISIEEKLVYVEKFIFEIDSWAITDSFVPALKIKSEEREVFWKFILQYTKSENTFEVRFAVVSMLNYYLTEQYVDKVIAILDNIDHEGYYVKMAVAWTLAEIGIKFYEKFITYFQSEKNRLDKFTYNKALQKMIESYRINSEQKDILKKLKRR